MILSLATSGQQVFVPQILSPCFKDAKFLSGEDYHEMRGVETEAPMLIV
jgi:hypothetical protein